jgi:hypothetical protein
MYDVWMKLGLVVDVGYISSSNLDAKVQSIIDRAGTLSSTAESVRSTIQHSAGFFDNYQIDLVGRLGETSPLPASEFHSESDRDWKTSLLGEVEDTSLQDSSANIGMVMEGHGDGTGIVAQEVHSNFDSSVGFSSSFPSYVKFDTASLENYFVYLQVNNPSRLWLHNLRLLSDSEKKAILDDRVKGYDRVFSTCLIAFANLLQHCCAEFYSDDISIVDIMIHYPQGVSSSLEELVRSPESMQKFLLQLRGGHGSGSAMCFQYGKKNCTPQNWATRSMKWKLVLPVALVKPLLAAAASIKKRESGDLRNCSAHYYIAVPSGSGNSSQDDQRQALKRSKPNYENETGRTEDQLCVVPHTYAHDFGNRSGMHLVDYACTMQELYDNAGMTETWWQNSFWWPLVGTYSSEPDH